MKKNKRVHFRISKEDLQRIDEMARVAGLSRSAFILQKAEQTKIINFDEEYPQFAAAAAELIPKLKSIGDNVNHIAILCNMGKLQHVRLDKTNEELGEVLKALEQLLKDLKKIKPRGETIE